MSHPILAAYRAAHVARCEAALARCERTDRWYPTGLPNNLIAAGCWLVANGYEGDASPAERRLQWGPSRYRLYLDALDPAARAAEIEEGRRALFEGRRPIVVAVELGRAA